MIPATPLGLAIDRAAAVLAATPEADPFALGSRGMDSDEFDDAIRACALADEYDGGSFAGPLIDVAELCRADGRPGLVALADALEAVVAAMP